MTSTSRSIEDFISELKALKATLNIELNDSKTRLEDLKKAKATLEGLQLDSGIIAGYNSQAVKDIEMRIGSLPNHILRIEDRIKGVSGALEHAIQYDRKTCQHDLEETGWNYHHNFAEYTCTKCGEHR